MSFATINGMQFSTLFGVLREVDPHRLVTTFGLRQVTSYNFRNGFGSRGDGQSEDHASHPAFFGTMAEYARFQLLQKWPKQAGAPLAYY